MLTLQILGQFSVGEGFCQIGLAHPAAANRNVGAELDDMSQMSCSEEQGMQVRIGIRMSLRQVLQQRHRETLTHANVERYLGIGVQNWRVSSA
jgi:hypothetical protein